MNCKEYLSLQSEYIDGCLEGAALEAVREHLAACPTCRRCHAEMEALVGTLHAMEDIPVPENLADEVIAAVLPAKKEKRVFCLPRFLHSWRTYSVAAACVLVVCMLYTQTFDHYKMTNDENIPPVRTASETPLPEAAFKAMSTAEPSGAVSETDNTAKAEKNATAYEYSVAPAENTLPVPVAENQPSAADIAEETPARAFSRMMPETDAAADSGEDAVVPETAAEIPAAVPEAASVPLMLSDEAAHDSAEQQAPAASATAEAADAINAPTAGAARASGGAASGGAISRITAQPYSLVSSLIQERVTFTVGDPAAEAIFQNTRSRGEAAVAAALDSAGITFSMETRVEADYTAQYNALASEANALSARIAGGETDLQSQLAQKETEMQKLQNACSTPALYLSIS